MIRTLTKRWHLCCYKHRRRNLNVTQIYILVKVTFFLERIQQSSLIIKKSNKQIKKTGILMKLTKNSVIIAKGLWTRYCIKKFMCELLHQHNLPPPPSTPVCIRSHFDGHHHCPPPPNVIIECPHKERSKNRAL